ncbi:MAG: hypothetical protein HYV60_15425 [Planctomycetia bacterium]|nr:hypothetical protein [Planctomycetia bacterium]
MMRRKAKVGRAGLERVATSQGKQHILAKSGTGGGDIASDSTILAGVRRWYST